MEYFKELIRLCRDLGGDVMVLGSPLQRNFGPEMTHDQAMDNACSVLSKLVPTLEKHQIRIAIEPLGPQEGNFLNHASQAKSDRSNRFRTNQASFGCEGDEFEGTPIDEIIRTNRTDLIHFHANDANRLGPGMGEIDFRPIFQALADVSYAGWVSVEVFDYSPGVENILRKSMETMLACESQLA